MVRRKGYEMCAFWPTLLFDNFSVACMPHNTPSFGPSPATSLVYLFKEDDPFVGDQKAAFVP